MSSGIVVIGGADGPTAILTNSSAPALWPWVLLALPVGAAVWFCLRWRKK